MFEYTVVELPKGDLRTREQEWTTLVNKVAAHGWRLVSVSPAAGEFGASQYGFFERPAAAGQ